MSSVIICSSGYSIVMETVFGLFSFWDDLTQGSIDWETYKLIPDAQKNLFHAGSWRIADKYGKTFNDQADVSGIWVADISYLGDKPSSAKMFVYDEDGGHEFDAPSSWVIPYVATLNKPQSLPKSDPWKYLIPLLSLMGNEHFRNLSMRARMMLGLVCQPLFHQTLLQVRFWIRVAWTCLDWHQRAFKSIRWV